MISDVLLPFITVGIAELGDKTQLAVLCLSSKTKNHTKLLLGVILAFAISCGLAVVLGDIITKLVPMAYIKIGAGIIFIIFGIVTLINSNKEDEKCDIKNPFLSGLGIILISEMGDKTQIATGLFATKFSPLLVFIGSLLALTVLSAMAVYAGKFVASRLNKRTISIAAGILFIVIGIFSFF